MFKTIISIVLAVILLGCDFEVPGADEKFGKQNFVSAVSIIELHKLRNGHYPGSLSELEFLGDWDGIWLSAVRYERNGEGYNLYLERGWAGKPTLAFPVKFKAGLGIKETNVQWLHQDGK
ncbi:hypothetical protein [Pseudoalteromonas sp. McH1-42]|uniref:hypothetical protein n=1 Tax=Pseudoalteromonas sp. McH1-42 TaxID=2917752 RepID=UPI001EF4551B|nr:hypothetical protein [Pseudoalteromonas sp. McH1-42]MCG7562387.1 hypothetical protein [Pseudoalteromonas sp. McH1-42]